MKKNRPTKHSDDDNNESPLRDVEDSVVTMLRIQREMWEIRRLQLRTLLLLLVLLSTLLTISMTLVR